MTALRNLNDWPSTMTMRDPANDAAPKKTCTPSEVSRAAES
jgi:hypothetical protein